MNRKRHTKGVFSGGQIKKDDFRLKRGGDATDLKSRSKNKATVLVSSGTTRIQPVKTASFSTDTWGVEEGVAGPF